MLQSAKLMNEAQPDFLSTLVVSFPMGEERFAKAFNGDFRQLKQEELFLEMKVLLENLDLKKTIFRSDHASNYLVLKGVLGQDKMKLLTLVNEAIDRPKTVALREEWQRGL